MRYLAPILAASMVTACVPQKDAATNNSGPIETLNSVAEPATPVGRAPVSLREMVMAGDAKACNHPAVFSYFRDEIMAGVVNPDPSQDYGMTRGQDMARARSEVRLSLDAVSVSAVDASIHSITCSGNVVVSDTSGTETFAVAYEIRPNLSDDATAIVRSDADQIKTIASSVQGAITTRAMSLTEQATGEDLIRRYNRRNSSSATPPPAEPEPQTSAPNDGDSDSIPRP